MLSDSKKKERREYLFKLINAMGTPAEVGNLMADLLTPTEMETLSTRAAIAKMMNEDIPAKVIAADLAVAAGSITKVHDVFKTGAKGYQIALKNLHEEQNKRDAVTKRNGSNGGRKKR